METTNPPTGAPRTARPFDAALSLRIDALVIQLEATKPKTISRGWVRLQKRIAERHVPALYGEVR